jgi:hypothetical protein
MTDRCGVAQRIAIQQLAGLHSIEHRQPAQAHVAVSVLQPPQRLGSQQHFAIDVVDGTVCAITVTGSIDTLLTLSCTYWQLPRQQRPVGYYPVIDRQPDQLGSTVWRWQDIPLLLCVSVRVCIECQWHTSLTRARQVYPRQPLLWTCSEFDRQIGNAPIVV